MEHVIIAGPTRTGTTSLFRYFQQNQEFIASKTKETNYFIHGSGGSGDFSLDAYHCLFQTCTEGSFFLEASPKYFLGGHEIASQIKETLGEAKIIITLRDPVERFISLYVHIITKRSINRRLSFDNFVKQNISYERSNSYGLNDIDLMSFYEGCYSDILPIWVELFGFDNVKVVFFEDMVDDGSTLMDIMDWLGLSCEKASFGDYLHENKATFYKNKFFHKIAMSLNDYLEPFFNKNQTIRETARNVYYLLNGKPFDGDIRRSNGIQQLIKEYSVKNHQLKSYLQDKGHISFPDWLLISN